jgi:hypothetical protein
MVGTGEPASGAGTYKSISRNAGAMKAVHAIYMPRRKEPGEERSGN